MKTEASSKEHARLKSTWLSFITRRGAPADSALLRPLPAHKEAVLLEIAAHTLAKSVRHAPATSPHG